MTQRPTYTKMGGAGGGRWFSSGTAASTITKTGRHDIAEILLKVALSTINQIIKSITIVNKFNSFASLNYYSL
jgi:hypothetical protein